MQIGLSLSLPGIATLNAGGGLPSLAAGLAYVYFIDAAGANQLVAYEDADGLLWAAVASVAA